MKSLEEYSHTQPDRCNLCGNDIIWVKGASGIAIPVDPEPVRDGGLIIIMGIVQPPLNDLLDMIHGPDTRYREHVRTCSELRSDEAIQQRIEKAMSKAPHPHEIKNCNCGAPMFFAPSALGNGKKLPLCAEPSPTGNVFLNDKHEAVQVSGKNPAPAGATLYLSHFANCPHKEQFRTQR